jgi:putative ABC transporter-associated repeat protein
LRALRTLTVSTVVTALCLAVLTPTVAAQAETPTEIPQTDAAIPAERAEIGASPDAAASAEADTGVDAAEDAGATLAPEPPPAPAPEPSPVLAPEPSPAPAPESGQPAGAVTVVRDGEVRIASRVVDGDLVQDLLAGGAVLDPARTVFHLPDGEGWPGGAEGQDPAFWDEIVADRGTVWRSMTPDTPGNALSLSLDAGGIPPSALYAPEWAPEQAVVRTWLGSVSDAPGGVLAYGRTDAGTSSRAGDAAPRQRTETGEGAAPTPLAVAFGATGRACVTLDSHAQLADGTFVNHDLALTFAVGIDPETVEPCAQPAAIAPQAPQPIASTATGTTVLDSGTVLMAPTLTDGELTLHAVSTDRGRTTAYDPARVVLSVPHRDARWPADGGSTSNKDMWARYLQEGTTAYRTSGRYVPDDRRLGDEQANDLIVDVDARFVSSDGLRVTPDEGAAVFFDFEGATTAQGSGRFFTYRQDYSPVINLPEDIGFWDSRADGERVTLGRAVATGEEWGEPFYTRAAEYEGAGALGTVFTDAGVYCLTVRSSTTRADGSLAEDRATFTFAVGVDASTVTPCAPASGGDPDDGGEVPGGEDPGALDPTVAWLQQGHTDLAVREDGRGGIEFATGDGHTDTGMHALRDSVWVGRGDFARFTVRPPDAADDRTFIGAPGTTYYGFSASSEYVSYTLWPGLSMLYLPSGFTERHATWSLQKVSGPGEAYAWSSTAFVLDSRREVPVPFSLGRTHRHLNWAFTEPGVYCLAVRADLRATSDESRDLSAASLLTVAVGDIDLSAVQPCERTTPVPDAPEPAAVALSTAPAVLDDTALAPSLELRRVNGVVDVVASVEEKNTARTTFFDPERSIYSAAEYAGTYRLQDRWRTLEWDAGGSDITVTLGAVEGPGAYSRRGNSTDSQAVQLDSGSTPPVTAETLWPGSNFPATHVFSAAGVYCVPLTWAGTLADGTAFRVSKTLTVAAGVGATGVTPCADGGNGTDPGGTDPEAPDVEWDVPNHTRTDSGATIVDAGHVDVAARLDGDRLTTVIADASDAAHDEILRAPSKTVLQVRPEAQTTVPDDPAYAFLGAAGAKTWLLPETESEGLLWPGWSTEAIPAAATTTGVTWTLDRAEGPGEFALYQTPFTGPDVYFDTRDGISAADTFEIPENIHAHGTWAFSAEGTYCLGFTRATTLASGERASDTFTLVFAVGAVAVTKIDPTRCFQTPDGAPSDPDTTPISLDALTDAARGGVQVLNDASGVTAGQLVTVQVDRASAGRWVSVWLGDTAWLGWARIGSSGAVQVRLPADAATGSQRLVVKDRSGALAGWDDLQIVASTGPGTPVDPDPGETGAWDVANGTVNRAGAIVLNDGHVDIASLVQDGRLVTRIKDSASVTDPVYRDVSRTVLQLKPGSRASVPEGDAWRFLGDPGTPFYQVTQTQQSGLVWPGWSTEGIPLSATTGGVTWSLVDVSGPGRFALYETGAFGQPSVLFTTHDGISAADRVKIPTNTHAHGSWAFSAEGNYCLSMQRTAQLSDGRVSSDTFVLAVAVGGADVMSVNPARCGESVDTGTIEVPAPPREDSAAATPAAQQLAAAACVAGATIISSGHVDYASRIVGGALQSLVGDDSSGTKVYREPASTVLWLKPAARVTLPAGFGQVGAAGSTVWQIPQTQNPDLVWLGWNTEALNSGNTAGPVRWTIDEIEGPGRVSVYLSGAFGGVQQTIFAGGGSYDIPLGVHAHANWAFSAEGVYRITSTQTATLLDGRVIRDRETLTIVVGDVDPRTAVSGGAGCAVAAGATLADTTRTAVAAEQVAADAADAARRALPGQGSDAAPPADALTALASGDPVPLLLMILGGVLLVAAAGAGTLWWRSRRRAGEVA